MLIGIEAEKKMREDQWKRISCKKIARWQHLTQLKVSASLSLQRNSCSDMQQLILVIGNAI